MEGEEKGRQKCEGVRKKGKDREREGRRTPHHVHYLIPLHSVSDA